MSRDPDVQGGVPVFTGTRVPVQYLIEYLASGHPLDAFLDEFPSVRRDQAMNLAQEALVTGAGSS